MMILGITPFDVLLIVVIILLVILTPILLRMRIKSTIAQLTIELEEMVNKSKENLKNLCIEKGNMKKILRMILINSWIFSLFPVSWIHQE